MRLLILTAAIMAGFLAVTLFFFKMKQKRYSGLGPWTAGAATIALGHLALVLRGVIPDFCSILIGNTAFPVGIVLFLDGMRRFQNLPAASPAWYAFPAATAVACSYFYFVQDAPALRSFSTAIAIVVPHIATAVLIFRHMSKEKLFFYPIIAVEMVLASLFLVVRAFWVLTAPNFLLFMESPVQAGFFVSVLVLEIVIILSFILLNSERLEKELLAADEDLHTKIGQLEKAMSEVRTLSGLLPICANCKKICDDKGSWHEIEEFIHDRSEADFSHGICPECAKALYPEYWERKRGGGE
jgi:hypothetical protein